MVGYLKFVKRSNKAINIRDFLELIRFGSSADLEVQLMQLNHCDGVLSNHLKYLIRATNISEYSNLYV